MWLVVVVVFVNFVLVLTPSGFSVRSGWRDERRRNKAFSRFLCRENAQLIHFLYNIKRDQIMTHKNKINLFAFSPRTIWHTNIHHVSWELRTINNFNARTLLYHFLEHSFVWIVLNRLNSRTDTQLLIDKAVLTQLKCISNALLIHLEFVVIINKKQSSSDISEHIHTHTHFLCYARSTKTANNNLQDHQWYLFLL